MADTTSYSVLKEVEAGSIDDPKTKVFVPLGTVDAQRGTDAIVKITKDQSAEEKNGNFAAPSTRNFPVIPRKVKVVEADEFGEQRSISRNGAGARASAAATAAGGQTSAG